MDLLYHSTICSLLITALYIALKPDTPFGKVLHKALGAEYDPGCMLINQVERIRDHKISMLLFSCNVCMTWVWGSVYFWTYQIVTNEIVGVITLGYWTLFIFILLGLNGIIKQIID